MVKFLTHNALFLQSTMKYMEREIINHFRLRHPHIIQLNEVFVTGDYVVMVMEYAPNGDLASLLRQNPSGVPQKLARKLFQQLILAVDFCHMMGICNRDIKMENILLSGEKKYLLKLADFGYSKDEIDSVPTSKLGTLLYVAPEIIASSDGHAYDGKKVDAWSCGIVLHFLMTGKHPFWPLNANRKGDDVDILECIVHGDLLLPSSLPSSCASLIKGLLEKDPGKRMSIKQIFKNEWFLEDIKPGVASYNETVLKAISSTPLFSQDSTETIRKLLVQC